jgi:hypothetical protein
VEEGNFIHNVAKSWLLIPTQKDLNRWFKVAIMGYQICYRKELVGLATLGRCHSRCGVNRLKNKFCQIWWRDEALNALGRRPLEQFFRWKPEEEDKQLTQNGALLVKFILVLRVMISLNYTPECLQTFNFVQYFPW